MTNNEKGNGMSATSAADRNANETFQGMLGDYRLKRIDGDVREGFSVQSASGGEYRVNLRSVDLDDGSQRFQWNCDCPSRKRCRHIDACEQVSWAEASAAGDYCLMDILEYTLD